MSFVCLSALLTQHKSVSQQWVVVSAAQLARLTVEMKHKTESGQLWPGQ